MKRSLTWWYQEVLTSMTFWQAQRSNNLVTLRNARCETALLRGC